MTPSNPASPRPPGPPGDGEAPLIPPESQASSRSQPSLDRLGLTQAIAGLTLGLIALFTSYDHITLAGRTLPIPQQWGIPCIAVSMALVLVDAQLATRSRLREAHERARDQDSANEERNRADRERNLAGEERQRADRERYSASRERYRSNRERNRSAEARERQAEAAERQRQATARLNRCALLSARVQLDPSASNRERLRLFLALMMEQPLDEEG